MDCPVDSASDVGSVPLAVRQRIHLVMVENLPPFGVPL